MTTEDKTTLARQRVELIARLAQPSLSAVDRVAIQGDLSIVNAKLKAIHTTEAAQLKAQADRRRVAGMTEARQNAARARANAKLPIEGPPDTDPGQPATIDAWIDDVLRAGGVTVHRASSDGARGIEVPASVPKKFTAAIHTLCAAIHAAARGEELPSPSWDGLCTEGKHGLDFEEQPCDLCRQAPAAETKPTCGERTKKTKRR